MSPSCHLMSDCVFIRTRVSAMGEVHVYVAAVSVQTLVSRWLQPASQISRCVDVKCKCVHFCLRGCISVSILSSNTISSPVFATTAVLSDPCVCACVLSRPSWVCVKLRGVVSSVRPGRQERGKRRRSVISAPSKLSWWMNSKNVRTYMRSKMISFRWITLKL